MVADQPGRRRDADRADEAEVVVLGMGPGGEYLAGTLAEAGLSVVGIEARLLGGECPYWGCVPSKMMIRAADLLAEGTRIPGMSGTSTVASHWRPVARRIRDEATDNWDDKVAVDRFTGKGGRFVRGRGRLTAADEITVESEGRKRVIRARRGIVINTGTQPSIPPIDGLADSPYWTNREAIETEEVPGSLVVLGGGAIGAELSQVFARFGARVTVVEAADRLLPMDEPEAGVLLAEVFGRDGIAVLVGAAATGVRHDGRQFTVALSGGEALTAERLLVATGRRTGLAALGVDAIGLDPAARVIDVDERMRIIRPGRTRRRWPRRWRARAVGDRRCHRQGRVHPRVDVPGRDRRPRHPRPRRPGCGVSRAAQGHLHRPGNRRGRIDRGPGGRVGYRRAHRLRARALDDARVDPQGRQRRLHQADRGRGPRRARGCDVGGTLGRRGARRARRRRARPY